MTQNQHNLLPVIAYALVMTTIILVAIWKGRK